MMKVVMLIENAVIFLNAHKHIIFSHFILSLNIYINLYEKRNFFPSYRPALPLELAEDCQNPFSNTENELMTNTEELQELLRKLKDQLFKSFLLSWS